MTASDTLDAAVVIVSLRKTCHALPAQWEGRTSDGRDIYIRYRWGQFSVGIGFDLDDAIGNTVYKHYTDDPVGGDLDTSDLPDVLPELITIAPDCVIDDPYGGMSVTVWQRDVLGYTE